MAKISDRKSKQSRLGVLRSSNNSANGEVADWGGVNAELLRQLVSTVSLMGGAVRYGYTRDGGAYSVGIYLDDDRETIYIRPGDDIDGIFVQIIDQLENVG